MEPKICKYCVKRDVCSLRNTVEKIEIDIKRHVEKEAEELVTVSINCRKQYVAGGVFKGVKI